MPATTARPLSAFLRTLPCRASAFARACAGGFLAAFFLFFSFSAHSEVALPNGDYREEIEDLRVQTIAGPIRVTRDYVFRTKRVSFVLFQRKQ